MVEIRDVVSIGAVRSSAFFPFFSIISTSRKKASSFRVSSEKLCPNDDDWFIEKGKEAICDQAKICGIPMKVFKN